MHWLALDEQGRSGAGGQVSSVKTGNLSMSFTAFGKGDLSQTMYGIELQELINNSGIGARTSSSYY
jgi:hypothetical protein